MNRTIVIALTTALVSWVSACAPGTDDSVVEHHPDAHGHDDGEPATGPNGGRLLEKDDFAVEILIAETGTPPEFRLYGFEHGRPLAPEAFDASVRLERLGNVTESFELMPESNYLRSIATVGEPHSFDVAVTAERDGRSYTWHYESHEGRTEIPDRVAQQAGVRTEIAGPQVLARTVELTGTVHADPERVADVRARFPGLLTAVLANPGDVVDTGQTLARVETNESLRPIDVVAPIRGVVVSRNAQPGQVTGDDPLFVVTNLDEVWVQLDVFGRDLALIETGQHVTISGLDGSVHTGTIDWISPLVAHASQSVRARVQVQNRDGMLRVGQFVRARVVVAEDEVPLAVTRSGLQRFRDFDVVFARFGETYEVRMLRLGLRDDEYVEVIDGLEPGTTYVTANSYLIKADIEKAGASHSH